jgi:transcriptional regulator with XRE-family HTH domain
MMTSPIRRIREEKGISLGELGRRTGLSRPTVQAADRGESISLETKVEIARALGVRLADIDADAADAVAVVV